MATYTNNYNLKKPAETDFYDIEDFNGNADIIDSALDDKLNSDFSNVSGGAVPIAKGGTGATTADGAKNNLGLGTSNTPTFNALNLTNATVNGNKIYTSADFNNSNLFLPLPNAENVDLLSYIKNLGYGKTGWFMATNCTNTPNSTNWWLISVIYNSGGEIVVMASADGYCYSNHHWGSQWYNWQLINATGSGIPFVSETEPAKAQNGDLWAW